MASRSMLGMQALSDNTSSGFHSGTASCPLPYRPRPASSRRGRTDDDIGGNTTAAPREGWRRIRKIHNFKLLYKVGAEVMASTHSYIKVNFGRRIEDGEECVIKIRAKPNCFRTAEDERSWRERTEFLLNMPLPEYIGVCKLFEVLEDGDAFYVVMERVRGVDLYEALDKDGPLSVDNAREILRHLLVSVAHLHTHNMVHKDLKLENVMVNVAVRGVLPSRTRKGYGPSFIKVIDFDTLDEWTPSKAPSKDVVGTDQYIAQEAYAGKYSPLSDVFAVGVIAYKLLSGKFPFKEDLFDDAAGEGYAGSPKMSCIRRKIKVAAIDFYSHQAFRENPSVAELVTRMLSYNECQRPTAAVALEHSFFREAGAGGPTVARPDCEELIDDDIIIAA